MNIIFKKYIIALFIPLILIADSIYSQNFKDEQPITFNKNSFNHPDSPKKIKIGNSLANLDSINSPSSLKPGTNPSEKKVKIGKIVAFATIGFFSGLFIGATTEQFGYFQGPVFRLQPALIGAGIGIAISFIVPDNKENKQKNKQF